MELNKQLQERTRLSIAPCEEKILETIEQSKEAYYQQTQNNFTRYDEFLWSQLRYTRKRWWALQCFLLWIAYQILPSVQGTRVREIGVVGCVFVIIAIPELWRNKSSDSVQVEAASMYSLRQIYAARMTLFGIVDIFLLTVFCLGLSRSLGLTVVQLLSQLLLPVTITASICFWVFYHLSEAAALWTCLIWSTFWWLILRNEGIYALVFSWLWVVLFGVSSLLFGAGIYRMLRNTNRFWEVTIHEITVT